MAAVVTALALAIAFPAATAAAPYARTPTISVSDGNPDAGGTVTVDCKDFLQEEKVSLDLREGGAHLATPTTDASGACSVDVTLPVGVPCVNAVVGTGKTSGDRASAPITIGDCALPETGASGRDLQLKVALLGLGLVVLGTAVVVAFRARGRTRL